MQTIAEQKKHEDSSNFTTTDLLHLLSLNSTNFSNKEKYKVGYVSHNKKKPQLKLLILYISVFYDQYF